MLDAKGQAVPQRSKAHDAIDSETMGIVVSDTVRRTEQIDIRQSHRWPVLNIFILCKKQRNSRSPKVRNAKEEERREGDMMFTDDGKFKVALIYNI